MKILILILPLVFFATACKKATKPDVKIDTPPEFRISDDDKAKLDSVGCSAVGMSVTCDGIEVQGVNEDDVLLKLERKKSALERRQKALMEVSKSITESLDKNQYEISSAVSARILSSSLVMKSTNTSSDIASKVTEITGETLFQTVIGFNCEGSNQQGAVKTEILKPLLFESLESQKTTAVKNQPDTDLNAQTKVDKETKKIFWQMSDSQDEQMKTFTQTVITDGEFTLKTLGGSNLNLGCMKARLAGASKEISDRAKSKRYLKCNLLFTNGPRNQNGNIPVLNWDYSFNVNGDEENQIIGFQNDDLGPNPHYSVQLTNVKGLLTFKVQRQNDGVLVSEFSTMNSTPNFSMSYLDFQHQGMKIDCK